MATPSTSARTASPSALQLAPAGLTVLVGILTVVVAARATGAAAPAAPGLVDPGEIVRWGIPVVRVIHDLAASLTIGVLVLAVGLMPGKDTAAAWFLRMRSLALWCGVVWALAGFVGVVLQFADIAGTPLTDPGYLAQFQTFVWTVEATRIPLISAVVVLVAVSLTSIATSRVGLTWAGVFAVLAVATLALAGHASGATDHETAVNSIGFHIVAVVVWVGGLLAIVVLRPVIGRQLATVLRRYSAVAGWCFVAVLLSGLVSSAIRLGGLAGLRSSYGAVLLAKVLAVMVLGAIGLVMRRRIVAALATMPQAKALFARLVVLEIALMGVATGAAVALTRSAAPVPDVPPASVATVAEAYTGFPPPPEPDAWSWLTVWRWDWLWGTAGVIAALLYLGAVVRLWRRGDRWPIWRLVSWLIGCAFFVWASSGAPGVYGRVSFAWHMLEHMFMAMVTPILLVIATPILLVIRAVAPRTDGSLGPRELLLGLVHSRYMNVMANPIVASALFFFSMVVFYYTPLFELALRSHVGHIVMIIHFVASGYLFAWVLIGDDPGPRKWPAAYRLLMLFATIGFHAFFGVALTSAESLLAPTFYGALDIPWIPDPLVDQHTGGAIAWGVGEAPSLLLALLVAVSWMRSDDAEARRHDRQAARDGDADLVAYNEQLARLAAADRREAARERAGAERAAAARAAKHGHRGQGSTGADDTTGDAP